MIRLKVVAVSKNTNSFGLRGMVIVGDNGKGYEAAANELNVKKEGVEFEIASHIDPLDHFVTLGFELGRELNAPPKVLVEKLFGKSAA